LAIIKAIIFIIKTIVFYFAKAIVYLVAARGCRWCKYGSNQTTLGFTCYRDSIQDFKDCERSIIRVLFVRKKPYPWMKEEK